MVGELVRHIGAFQAVPTSDWSQHAAAALLRLTNRGPLVVGLCRFAPGGAPIQIEDSGAAGARDTPRRHLRALLDPERAAWDLAPGETASAIPSADHVPLDELAPVAREAWSAVGAVGLVRGSAALSPGAPQRRVRVLLGMDASLWDDAASYAAVLSGVLGPLAQRMGQAFGREAPIDPSKRLTAREAGVLSQLLLGLSIRQIADKLDRSPHTVHDHVKSLHTKLGANSRGELVARALGHLEPAGGAPGEDPVAVTTLVRHLTTPAPTR